MRRFRVSIVASLRNGWDHRAATNRFWGRRSQETRTGRFGARGAPSASRTAAAFHFGPANTGNADGARRFRASQTPSPRMGVLLSGGTQNSHEAHSLTFAAPKRGEFPSFAKSANHDSAIPSSGSTAPSLRHRGDDREATRRFWAREHRKRRRGLGDSWRRGHRRREWMFFKTSTHRIRGKYSSDGPTKKLGGTERGVRGSQNKNSSKLRIAKTLPKTLKER